MGMKECVNHNLLLQYPGEREKGRGRYRERDEEREKGRVRHGE